MDMHPIRHRELDRRAKCHALRQYERNSERFLVPTLVRPMAPQDCTGFDMGKLQSEFFHYSVLNESAPMQLEPRFQRLGCSRTHSIIHQRQMDRDCLE